MMDIGFSKEDLAFREEVREFLDENLSDHLRTATHRTPGVFVEPDIGMEWHRKLNDRGWGAHNWPEEYGGTGWSATQTYIFEKECALAGAPGTNPIALKLLGPVLCEFGTPEQKDYFLPRILSGEDIWAQGYSEPGSGSDLASLKTAARLEGDQYIINGTKIWTTHAHHANWIFCLVRTSNEGRKQQGITFLLVPMDQEGVSVTPIMSMSEDHEVNQVFFDNAVADAKYRVGEEGQGWSIAKFLLENERGGGCSAPRLLRDLEKIRQAASSQASGVNGPMIHDGDFQRRFARLQLEAEALEFTELRILAEVAKGNKPGPRTSAVKYITANLSQQIDELHLDLYGYAGLQLPRERPLYGNDTPEPVGAADAQIVLGQYLNSRAATIYGGSNEVQRSIIAKTVLGL